MADRVHENMPVIVHALFVVAALMSSSAWGAEPSASPKLWRGYAILGNGHVCAVYSDDPRVVSKTGRQGIHHFYHQDYSADYIRSTSFQVQNEAGHALAKDVTSGESVGMENWFTALTQTNLVGDVQVESRAFAHPRDAVVLTFKVKGASRAYRYSFRARLPRRIVTDGVITRHHAATTRSGALVSWSDGTSLAIGTHADGGRVGIDDRGLVIDGDLDAGAVAVIIVAADSREGALKTLSALRRETSLQEGAAAHWAAWLNDGIVPDFDDEVLLEAYCRNLYAAKSASLNGQIPADITGQFVTNNMPQLYPRDALMCARIFLLTGHLPEVRQVLAFWADPRIPMKSPGEWYARYDARGGAVDAGTGARYDEPEWDANGYFIQLAHTYHEVTGQWPAHPTVLGRLADFLVSRIDSTGLLYEGGIVEGTGYLPATNMIAAAALKTAAKIAHAFEDTLRGDRYHAASERISNSLGLMFDPNRGTYADLRFSGRKGAGNRSFRGVAGDTLYLWDTSANFGVLWGYPNHREIIQSNEFYAHHCVKLGGGMQYFNAPDPGLAGYGHDVFFFTTAAAAQYHARFGDPERAQLHIDWMLENANVYGLMPERVFLRFPNCSEASPLSWCCAEFAAALLEWQRATH